MTRVNIPRATNPCRLRKLLLALPLVWLGLSLGAPEARAARPMLTDDARVVDMDDPRVAELRHRPRLLHEALADAWRWELAIGR